MLPELGESVTEGTVTRWLKKVGDSVEVDEALLEISTDKVDTEIPSPFAGVLQEILVQEDETVAVGSPLARIGEQAPQRPAAPRLRRRAAEAPAPAAAAPAPRRRSSGARRRSSGARAGTRARRPRPRRRPSSRRSRSPAAAPHPQLRRPPLRPTRTTPMSSRT